MNPFNRMSDGTATVLVIVMTFLLAVAVIAGFSALSALILMLAWNAFMPHVFGLPEVSFVQAFALTFLIGAIKGLVNIHTAAKE